MPKKDESNFSIKVPKLQVAKKTYDFSLTLPGMISAVGAGVLALTFFFVMGILIGRGYRPEADVPQLEEIMPSKQHGRIAEAPLEPEILKPEELEYSDRLKEDKDTVLVPEQAEETDTKAETAEKPQPEAPKEAANPAPAPAQKAEPAQPAPKTGEAVFDYIYQAASFRQQEMANALSSKLAKEGLVSRVEAGEANGSTWYRVYVSHHGTPSSTDSMKAVLEKFGIQKPLLRKKTPVQ